MNKFLPNITICIIMDLLGMATFTIPVFGELLDVVFAPVSAIIFYLLFGRKIGLLGGVFNFMEELFPFTDFIPTFTIAWFIRKHELSRQMISGSNY